MKSSVETRVETRVEIVEQIKKNPNITNKELASALDLTIKAIEWQMKKLKDEKILKRVGSTKSGYWEIIK
ncbi:MAG: winged helix-turn-helix transcriptional regulator [Sulfurimonas sp.]|nr:winged helix-turn-helix transcriptional regulator [Sulfurimonas sp.]